MAHFAEVRGHSVALLVVACAFTHYIFRLAFTSWDFVPNMASSVIQVNLRVFENYIHYPHLIKSLKYAL